MTGRLAAPGELPEHADVVVGTGAAGGVVDSSVMPAIVRADTQAATVMIAERAAGLLAAAPVASGR